MPIPFENPHGAHALETLLARERSWAERARVATSAGGWLTEVRDALCFEPDEPCRARLSRHPDRPLGEPGKPGKPGAVCEPGSAWALACNLLEAVPDDRLDGLVQALGAPGTGLRRSWLHAPHDDLHVDGCGPILSIERASEGPVYVEVRTLDLALPSHAPTSAQLPHPESGWGDLEACRRLAIETARREVSPLALAATLRRLRSLTRTHGRRGFRYVVVRSRFGTPHDAVLRRAFDALRMRIGGEIDLGVMQAPVLVDRLADTGAHPTPGWIRDRFCVRS